MKLRHVFSTRDAGHALVLVRMLHAQGLDWESISLVARDDIELDRVPHRMKDPKSLYQSPAGTSGLDSIHTRS